MAARVEKRLDRETFSLKKSKTTISLLPAHDLMTSNVIHRQLQKEAIFWNSNNICYANFQTRMQPILYIYNNFICHFGLKLQSFSVKKYQQVSNNVP